MCAPRLLFGLLFATSYVKSQQIVALPVSVPGTYVMYLTNATISGAPSSWIHSRSQADAFCAAYARDNGILIDDARILYSTADEDAMDFINYKPGVDTLVDKDGVLISMAQHFDGTNVQLPNWYSEVITGSDNHATFHECTGTFPAGSWPICQYCHKKFTCSGPGYQLFSNHYCCWYGTRQLLCVGKQPLPTTTSTSITTTSTTTTTQTQLFQASINGSLLLENVGSDFSNSELVWNALRQTITKVISMQSRVQILSVAKLQRRLKDTPAVRRMTVSRAEVRYQVHVLDTSAAVSAARTLRQASSTNLTSLLQNQLQAIGSASYAQVVSSAAGQSSPITAPGVPAPCDQSMVGVISGNPWVICLWQQSGSAFLSSRGWGHYNALQACQSIGCGGMSGFTYSGGECSSTSSAVSTCSLPGTLFYNNQDTSTTILGNVMWTCTSCFWQRCPVGHEPVVGQENCSQCQPGTWGPGIRHQCNQCGSGKWSALAGASSINTCSSCPAGRSHSTLGASTQDSCTTCARGRWSSFGPIGCTDCPAGRYGLSAGASASESCYKCLPGKWSPGGAPSCSDCPVGRWLTVSGLTLCNACPAGKSRRAQDYGCQSCTPGTWSPGGQESCQVCPAGRHNLHHSGNVESSCNMCMAGTWSTVGSSTCTSCPPGRWSATQGASSSGTCRTCPLGSYGLNAGASDLGACRDCEAGKWSSVPTASCNLCPAGRESIIAGASNQNTCVDCQAGFWSSTGTSACIGCVGGRFSTEQGMASPSQCVYCQPGTWSSTGQTACHLCSAGSWSSGGLPACNFCRVGKFSHVRGASEDVTCQNCAAGAYASAEGQTVCALCGNGYASLNAGASACELCHGVPQAPRGALACCPSHSQWPPLDSPAELVTAPGKSSTLVYSVPKCLGSLSQGTHLEFNKNATIVAGNKVFLATPGKNGLQSCTEIWCGSNHCEIRLQAGTTNHLEPGSMVTAVAYIDVKVPGQHSVTRMQCPKKALLQVTGFGCDDKSMWYFFAGLTCVVALTVMLGLLVEAISRSRVTIMVQSRLDIMLPAAEAVDPLETHTGMLPTASMLRASIARALQVSTKSLPQSHFDAWLTQQFESSRLMLHIEFAVRPSGGKHNVRDLRRRLQSSVWLPLERTTWWSQSKVETQSPSLLKAVGRAPGADLLQIVEDTVSSSCGRKGGLGVDREALHLEVARELLEKLTTSRARTFLIMQYLLNLAVSGALPALAYFQTESCEQGYPITVHAMWLGYLVLNTTWSMMVLRYFGGKRAKQFMWTFRWRLSLRMLFAAWMLTDTYQDATFPVIAKTCKFSLWFVSAYLVVLGVGVMQAGTQIFMIFTTLMRQWAARTPEQHQHSKAQTTFLALRGSDSLMLVYAVRPAVEEILGGASSWAMKTSEARIAFFRFVFEDVEQSALQVVFLIFYDAASDMDRAWVVLSMATSLLLSFTLVVQCLPEVRDWLYHRILAQLPGAHTCKLFRLVWLSILIVIYRLIAAFPWISACSSAGDVCDSGNSLEWWQGTCRNGRSELLGRPSQKKVIHKVLENSVWAVCGLFAASLLAAFFWSMPSFLKRFKKLCCSCASCFGSERYNLERRFFIDTESLRPRVVEDDDGWLAPARDIRAQAMKAMTTNPKARRVAKAVQQVDRTMFKISRARAISSFTALRNQIDKKMSTLTKAIDDAQIAGICYAPLVHLGQELVAARDVACVRQSVHQLLTGKQFLKASLREKARLISIASGDRAPLRLLHWSSIDRLGELPCCGHPDGAACVDEVLRVVGENLSLIPGTAERHLVAFFLSHRWLRTKGPHSSHHPDTEDGVKAARLVAFAKWFMSFAKSEGLRCEVAFWIDYCCCSQNDPKTMDLGIAALPLYIATCTKVVAWRTADFERRCWTMVERLLSYSFCVGGLTPYVIDETFASGESHGRSAPAIVLPQPTPPPPPPLPLWEVFIDDRWVPYDDTSQDLLRSARTGSMKSVQLQIRGKSYEVDMETLSQTNLQFGTVRPIREVHSPPAPRGQSLNSDTTRHARPLQKATQATPLTLGRPSAGSRKHAVQEAGANRHKHIIHRRAKKLLNPLDFDVCHVSQVSHRRQIEQLVDIARSVPVIEVFADRQSIEWGLTEIVEQSLAARLQLPSDKSEEDSIHPAKSAKPEWLELHLDHKAEWRLVVKGTARQEASRMTDDTEALVWIDSGVDVKPLRKTDAEIGLLFEGVNKAIDCKRDVNGAIHALICGLKADLEAAVQSGDAAAIAAAVCRTQDVDLPEKKNAVQHACLMRLRHSLEMGKEVEMRSAMRMARDEGVHDVAEVRELYQQVEAEQQALSSVLLLESMEKELATAAQDDDGTLLAAVYRTASNHGMQEMMNRAIAVAHELIKKAETTGDISLLEKLSRDFEQGDCPDLAEMAGAAAEQAIMKKILQECDGEVADSISLDEVRKRLRMLRQVQDRACMLSLPDIELVAGDLLQKHKRHLEHRYALPDGWDVIEEQALGQGPLLKKKEERTSVVVSRVQNLLDLTYTGWGPHGKSTRTRDRHGPIAKQLQVMSVVHVQNAEAFVKFRAKREAIRAVLPHDVDKWEARTSCVSLRGVGGHSREPVDRSINEFYLWHGTGPEGARGITDDSFDIKRSGTVTGSLFGAGIYFAESSLKADEYTKPDENGWYPLILCRVVLGHVNYCSERDPRSISKQLEDSCSPEGGFHSVLGDRERVHGTFREFIVFDDHQIYPEYLVWYMRSNS